MFFLKKREKVGQKLSEALQKNGGLWYNIRNAYMIRIEKCLWLAMHTNAATAKDARSERKSSTAIRSQGYA